jgi:hypothetical protein
MMNVDLQVCKQNYIVSKNICNNYEHKINGRIRKSPYFDNIMDEDFGMVNELSLLASNIQKEVYVVLDSFFSFLRKY